MKKKMICSENIVKSFGAGEETHNILDNISVEIKEGEFVAVMGPSGCGKSTLMYSLSGMDSVDSGKIYFEGRDLAKFNEKELADIRRKEMGFVFQQPTMLKNLNVLDNIILPSMRDKKKNPREIINKAKALMEKTEIHQLQEREITQVSGGQLQRAGICRALMNHPKIMFADEPTGALNTKSAQDIMKIFSDINNEGTTIMLVTHDVKVAAWAERLLFMRDGKIISEMKCSKFDGKDTEDRVNKITIRMQELGI